ncbi:response regulator transcription factor (plasmid) [Devosia sp. A8/3-2]|nr:response regulator transcription factor [Devosia sp. A8/3-2]
MRLLLVEDEPDMAEALGAALSRHAIAVDYAGTLAMAREALASKVHDIVLIDRQLPDGDGVSLIATLRLSPRPIATIVISALGTSGDRIKGLNLGADDYLPKPFEVEELLARIAAVRRRAGELSEQQTVLAELCYDSQSREALVRGIRVELTRRELLILESLLRRLGRTVTKTFLEDAVYTFDDEIQSNSLEANVSRLRKKLVDIDAGVEIHNIRGVGYLIRPAA